jgi:4'-phosphopantetheinyl transferase
MAGWLTLCRTDVPAGDGWLSTAERDVQNELRLERRRADWRLGRWTAKRAVAGWVGADPAAVEVLAAHDGAPEAWVEGVRAPLSLSISHRAGLALAAVADAPAVIGCDLEFVEPRSGAFVREWLSRPDQGLLAACPPARRPELVNLLWTAREAAAKVRREGLRLDVRDAVVAPAVAGGPPGSWRPLRVAWDDGTTEGWWRADGRWVMTIAGRPAPGQPRLTSAGGVLRAARPRRR